MAKKAKVIAIAERNVSVGVCGAVYADFCAATANMEKKAKIYDFIIGLGGGSVLDLGCGSGGLLARLRERGHARLAGVELDETKILAGIQRGIDVIQADLNHGLKIFADQQLKRIDLAGGLVRTLTLLAAALLIWPFGTFIIRGPAGRRFALPTINADSRT
jgi:SAM-dependent methyltransferase